MQKPYLIGITGGSGSGKTTFLRKLAAAFSAQEICVVSQDDYYRPREEQLVDDKGIQNFDLPQSINADAFALDLQKLMRGEAYEREEYTFNNKLATPKILRFEPAPIVIVEGLFIFHFPQISELLDLKLFLQTKENLKVIRRIKRDQIERNYPLEDVLYRYEHHVMPAYEQFVVPYLDESDMIINNNKHFDQSLAVLIGFLKTKLSITN